MKRPKLIAFDIDGTILNGSGQLTERTKRALRGAARAGIRLAAATGRMYPSAMIHIKDIGIEGACIFYNGALIRDTGTGETLYERNLGRELTAEILALFREKNWYVQLYSEDELIVENRSDERCAFYENICSRQAVALGGSFWNCGLDTPKMLGISFDSGIFAAMRETVRREFGARLYQTTSWDYFLEMVHPSVNKASALRRLCGIYGLSSGDVMAIGDGNNDAEMIRWAGTGVAMGNARASVKEAADIVAPPNTEDGAAQIIEAAIAAGG